MKKIDFGNAMLSNDSAFFSNEAIKQVAPGIFDHLTTAELKKLITNKDLSVQVDKYITAKLAPYDQETVTLLPNLDEAKRAMALALVFYPGYIQCILKLHQELLTCVLETRMVTITNPLTHETFTARWHFKLSHLVACEGRKLGWSILNEVFDKEIMRAIFSESICWESYCEKGNLIKGDKGPTPICIAILYAQKSFFFHVAECLYLLKPEGGFDAKYNQINPAYHLMLQDLKNVEDDCGFDTFLQSYAGVSSSFIQQCIDIAYAKALKEDCTFLNLFLRNPSADVQKNYLQPKLFDAIKANHFPLIKLIAAKIDSKNVRDENFRGPLYISIKNALKDEAWLPLVKFFLCCGYKREEEVKSPKSLLPGSLGKLFSETDSTQKKIQRYFKVVKYFERAVNRAVCEFDGMEKIELYMHPLQAAAELDTDFFNELVASYFPHGNEPGLNKDMGFVNRLACFKCLHAFIKNHHGALYLSAETLEKIGDALIHYRKKMFAQDKNPLDFAVCFYEAALDKPDNNSELRQRVSKKLEDVNEKNALDLATSFYQLSLSELYPGVKLSRNDSDEYHLMRK